ncbi:MAG: hypothetical protein O9341_21325 [Paucibacter sp.]|nr:hypothetical protein [Roseateles sp.]
MLHDHFELDKGEPEPDAATLAEIAHGVRQLASDKPTLARLQRGALWVLARTPMLRDACTPEDLVQTALLTLLEGRRAWKQDQVDLIGLILGTMRSLAYNNERILRETTVQTVPMVVMTPGELPDSPAMEFEAPSPALTPEEALLARQDAEELDGRVNALRALWPLDDPARQILEHLLKGKSKRELRPLLGLSDKEYWSADRRLTRAIDAMALKRSQR